MRKRRLKTASAPMAATTISVQPYPSTYMYIIIVLNEGRVCSSYSCIGVFVAAFVEQSITDFILGCARGLLVKINM